MRDYRKFARENRVVLSVIAFILAGNLIFGKFFLLNLSATLRWRLVHHEYPYLDPSSSFIDRKDLVVNVQPLREYLTTLNKDLGPNKMSLYFEVLNTGANISINKDLKIFPASIAKLPLAIVVMKKVENRQLHLGNMITLTADDIDSRSGDFYQTLPGTAVTVEQALEHLLINSDNTAQHALLKIISPADMEDLIDETGLEDLANPQGEISAKEYTRLLRTLYFSSYLEQEDSEKILTLLSQASFHDFLSQGVPGDVVFAHKYGEEIDAHIYNDSGIVFLPNRPYMMTVMFQGIDRDKAKELMKLISEHAYEYMRQYNH